jgi:protein TonB
MIDTLLRDNLVAAAVQAGLLVLAAAPLPRLLGVFSPRARLAYWRIVMIACVALPLLQPRVALDRPAPAAALASPAVVAEAAAAAGGDDGIGAEAGAAELPRITVGGVIVAGAALRLAWLGLGLFVLSRLRRGAVRLWPRAKAVDEAVEAAEADAEFLVSPRALRPMTFGFARPVVLVPSDFPRFPHDQQKAVACHELLHVRRFDWLRAAGDEIVRSLAWFHPAAWWLTGQIHLSREQLVDEQVVRRLGGRRQYLEALLQLASTDRRGGLLPASLFLGRSHLPQRVALLVKEVRMSRLRLVLSFVVMASVLALCGGAASAAFPLHRTVQLAPPALSRTAVETLTFEGDVVSRQAPGHVDSPRRLLDVRPQYPADVPVEPPGSWFFEITVDATGNVADIVSLSGPVTRVAEAASDAVRRWTFTPPSDAPHRMLVGFNLAAGRNDRPGREPVRVGGDITPPVKVHDVRPVYSKEALDAGVQGIVILDASIDSDGLVSDARVVRSVPMLDRQALDAVLQWRFTPRGVPLQITFTINFTLSDGPAREVRGAIGQGVEGGVEGGVAGGVEGGVAGGVKGGVAGGVKGGVGAGAGGGTGAGGGAGVGPGSGAGIGPGSGAGIGPGSGAGSAAGYVRVGDATGIAPPKKVTDVRPIYPASAKEQGIEGVVVLEAAIDPDGRVGRAKVVRSVPELDQAALDAVTQWVFTPTLKNGIPVGVIMTVTVNFALK